MEPAGLSIMPMVKDDTLALEVNKKSPNSAVFSHFMMILYFHPTAVSYC